MKKTYDILVNYQKIAYEFYDWNKTDDVKHIKVIPTFKVSDKCLQDFYNYDLSILNNIIEGVGKLHCHRPPSLLSEEITRKIQKI